MSNLFTRMTEAHKVLGYLAVYRCALYSSTYEHRGYLCSITWLDTGKKELLRYTPEFGFSDLMRGRQWGDLNGYSVLLSDGFDLSLDKQVIKY